MTLLFVRCASGTQSQASSWDTPSTATNSGSHGCHGNHYTCNSRSQNVLILCNNILKKLLKFMCRNPECRSVASASKDGTVRIWDTMLFKTTLVLSGHTRCVTCVRWGGEGLIYTSSQDRTIKVWRAKDVSGLNFGLGVHIRLNPPPPLSLPLSLSLSLSLFLFLSFSISLSLSFPLSLPPPGCTLQDTSGSRPLGEHYGT